ncbi:disulfide bond formation protein DsbA [bacterium]|nr:disulfide bond formation protein DsbA [Candidatus Elulimicrobium humile]
MDATENNLIGKVIVIITVLVVAGAIFWGIRTQDSGSRNVNVEVTDEDTYLGNKDAKVTLVEYSDFQCPACKAYEDIVKQLIESYSAEDLKIVYRHFPLRSIHPNADLAAQAAEAAGEEGKFWEMKDLLFKNQAEWAQEKDPRGLFGAYAKSLGLDVAEFDEDLLPEDDSKERVEKDYKSGVALGVISTPTFILNGVVLKNPQNLDEFKKLINAELKK